MYRLEPHDIERFWYSSGGVEVGLPGSKRTHVKAFPTWTRKPDGLSAALETAASLHRWQRCITACRRSLIGEIGSHKYVVDVRCASLGSPLEFWYPS
jgi:hypothetical protein